MSEGQKRISENDLLRYRRRSRGAEGEPGEDPTVVNGGEAVERGETDNLHQVMIAQNQAQLSLRLAAEVRDKLVEAYREVMRTQF